MKELIYRHVCSKEYVIRQLAAYNGMPAIFHRVAPDDTDERWDDTQKAHIVYDLVCQGDSESNGYGILNFDIKCKKKQGESKPEIIADLVREAFNGYFFTENLTVAVIWSHTLPYTESDNEVTGVKQTFDVIAFPLQSTYNPDPVKALNNWIKERHPEVLVMGEEQLEEVSALSDGRIALYSRFTQTDISTVIPSKHAVTWMDCEIMLHIMSRDEEKQMCVIRNIGEGLLSEARISMQDGSMMFINGVVAKMNADQLRQGQVQVKATFGILPKNQTSDILNKVFMEEV